MPKRLPDVILKAGQNVVVRGPQPLKVNKYPDHVTVVAPGTYVEPPPTDPKPVISNIVVTPAADGGQIAWHVSEFAKGEVRYGPTAALGSATKRQDDFTYQDHIQQIKGVTYKTVYYQVWAQDSAGQEGLSPIAHFDTSTVVVPIPPDPGVPPGPLPPGTDVFHGTGGDDTNNLVAFIQAHHGQTCAIDGTVKIGNARPTLAAGALTRIVILPTGLLRPTAPGKAGIQLVRCFDTQVDGYRFQGSSFYWDPGNPEDPLQTESGLEVYGGDRIVINDAECWNTRGDGIYTGSDDNLGVPAGAGCKGLTLNRPKMHHNGRNGITGNVGTTVVTGPFTIDQSGLMNIDLEPNFDADAGTIDFVAADGRLTNHGVLDTTFTGWAFAACGKTGQARPRIDLRRISSDEFTFSFQNVVNLTLQDLSSDVPVDKSKAVYYAQIQHMDFQRLHNITPYEYANCN